MLSNSQDLLNYERRYVGKLNKIRVLIILEKIEKSLFYVINNFHDANKNKQEATSLKVSA